MGTISWATKVLGGTGDAGYFTPDDAEAVKAAVNDNDGRIGAVEAISGILKLVAGSPAAAAAWDDYLAALVNILDPVDGSWQGQWAEAVAGESMSAADQWRPLCRKDTGAGTRYYFYDPDESNGDNDVFLPVALLITADTIAAGESILVTSGDGILANDAWSAAQANVGKDLFCVTGGVSFTQPAGVGDVIKKIGSLESVSDRQVWQISFSYPEVLIES